MKKVFSFLKNAGVVAKAPPTSGAKVPPTSQGCSGMEARRPNFRDDDMNAIHLAARDDSGWRVKQILSFRKSDLNSRDKKHRTALHVACAYGRPRMVRLLIERQCLLDLRDSEKKTALIQALQYQNVKCATILLDSSADPNVMDNDGNTALHYAVLGHNKAIVEKLLAHKANTELRNKRGLTPLALAKLANNDEMVKLLERRATKDDPRKWKKPLIYEYKEERRPQTFQSSNLAFIPIATNLQESTKSAQTQTKSKTVDEIAAEDSLNSKQQLTSEYKEGKKPPKSESSNLATDLQESPKSAQTKTKSKTVDEISPEGSLNRKQQLTSEYEQGRTQTLESSLFVEDISEEDALSSKQQLTSEYQERRRPHRSECTHRVIDLRHTQKQAWTERKSNTVDEMSEKDSLSRKQQLTSEYEQGRTQTLESSLFVEDISEEDALSSKQQLTSEYQERRRPHRSESTHHVIDLRHTQKQAWTERKSNTVDEMSEKDSLSRLSRKSGIDDAWPTSSNEDFKDKVISKTCILTAKTSENQSKHINLPPLHLEKMTQESQINRACDKEDTSAYSGHPSVQKEEEMGIKQGTLEQRKNLRLSEDESKQRSHEFSVKFKMTECPEEEPLRDDSKEGASLRQTPSNLTGKMLDCEGKGAFGMSVSAALKTFPEGEETSLKIVPPSHADPGSPEDSLSSSSSELRLRENELHSENDHKPDVEHFLNKNEESFYNDTENKKVRHPVVTSKVREDQEFAMQMTKNMNPNTTDWKLGIGPTPQSCDLKSHLELQHPCCNETKLITEIKSHDMSAVTNTYKETKPNQDVFQKPLRADNCSANYYKSMDSKLKVESSSALHNDRTPGVYVKEELQRVKNKVDMFKAEHLAWKRKKIQHQKEVEEKKEQKSSKREVSGNMDEGAHKDSGSTGLSQQSNKEHTDNQRPNDKINENTVIFMNTVITKPNNKINENTVFFMNKVEEKKEQKSSKREVSGNMDEGADDDRDSIGLNQQSNSEQSDKMSESTAIPVKKVEEKKEQKSSEREVSGNMDEGADDSGSGGLSQQSNSEQTDKQQVSIMENEESDRLCSKPGIGDSRPISHNEDLKDKVISETHTMTAKTSKNQSKQIHLPPLHLEKMTQESQINRACDKEDTSAYSGHISVQRDKEMCNKQGTLEQRKNLQLPKDESKQRSHEFSVKFKMTECPEEEPLRDDSKEGASLRQTPSNLTGKMLDCEGKDAFGKSISTALKTFPEREETSLKIVSPSHADPGSPEDSPWSSPSELCLRERKLHSENDHKPEAEHVLNKNEESFYNDTENKKVRHPVVTFKVREDQEFAMQITKNMNPNTTDWKLGIGPTPQSCDLKSHLELQHPCCNETKLITEIKSHDMSAVTNTYKETKPNQDLFQKPLRADNCSANYCKSMDSKLKDESSSALHKDRTPGVYVKEELQRVKNEVDMFKAEHLAWKRKKIQHQKEVEEEKKQKSSERKVSGNMYNAADDDSDGRSQKNKVEQTDKQQLPVMGSQDSDRFTLEEEKEKRQKVDLLYEKNRVQLRKKEEHSIKEVEMNPCLQNTIRTRDIVSKIVRENKVVEEQTYTQSQLSQEQNARILQDGNLNKHLCKPKEIEITYEKMNSEVSESSEKEKSRLHENRMLWDEIAKLRLEINTVKNQVQEMGKKCFEEIAIVKEKSDRLEKTIRKTVFQHNAELEVLRAELIMLNSKLEDEQQNRRRLEAEVESYRSRLATAVQDHEHCPTSKGDLQLTFQRARDEGFCLWDKMNSDMSNLKYNNEILSQQLSKLESKRNNLEIELHHTRDALKERTLVLERDLIQKQCQKEEIEHTCQKEQGKVDKDIGKQESLQEKLSHLQSENMLLRQQLDQAHIKADREEKTAINIQHQIQDKISILNAECVKQIHMLNERINELINEWQHFKERIHQYENDHVERNVPESSEKEECLLHENCMLWDENAKLRLEIDTAKNQKQEIEKSYFEDIANVKEKFDHLEKTIREIVFQRNEQLEVLRVENTVLNSKLEDEQQNRGRLEAEVESYRSRLATAVQDHEHCPTSKGDLQLASQRARDEGFCAGRSFYKPVESQHEKEDLKKYIESNIFLQQRWQQAANTKKDLEKEKTRLKELLKVAKKKLHECDNEELSFPGDSKPSPADMEIQSKKPKQKNDELTAKLQPSSSKSIHLDEEKTPLQQLAMEALLKECEDLENTAKKWEQENVNLRTHMEMNMVESCVAEEYKKNIEERTRRDEVDKSKQINSFLQTLRESQEMSEQMINNQDAIRSSLELRNKELKSELSRVQDSRDDRKRELEKYVQLYQEQVIGRKLLENQLTDFHRTKERLAEVSTELLETQRNRFLLSAQKTRPVLTAPCVGNLNNSFLPRRNSTPRENLDSPTSRSYTLTFQKMWQEFEETLTRELKEDAAKFEAETYRACSVAPIYQSSSTQDLILKTQQEYKEILLKNYMI